VYGIPVFLGQVSAKKKEKHLENQEKSINLYLLGQLPWQTFINKCYPSGSSMLEACDRKH